MKSSSLRYPSPGMLLLALTLFFAGCGGEGEAGRSDSPAADPAHSANPEGDHSSASDPAHSSASDGPVRALALVPSFAEIALAIGAADQLVARTDFDNDPALAALPSVGGGLDPNLEAMVDIGVDLVLMPEGRDMPAIARQFESLGIETLLLPTQSIEDLHTSIDRLGEVFDRRDRADSLSTHIAQRLDDLRASMRGREPVSVLYVVWSDPPMTTGGGTFIDEVITIAGGRNVYADALLEWPTVGYESIVERSPNYVLWPEGEITEQTIGRISEMAGWAQVPAIREGRVVLIDTDLFGRPGPHVADAALRLAESLHPDLF